MRALQRKTTPDVELLCDLDAWQEGRKPGWAFWPLGLVRILVRLTLLLTVPPIAARLPAFIGRRAFAGLRAIMGIKVSQNLPADEVHALTAGCVVASNHISIFDFMAAFDQPQAAMIIANDGGRLIRTIFTGMAFCAGTQLWFVQDIQGLARHFRAWRKDPCSASLYVTPEQTIGNQRGLFAFEPTFLDRGMPVVPLAARMVIGCGLNPDPLLSSKLMNFLRLLAAPSVRFELHFLARQTKGRDQSPDEFARAIQEMIASALGIPATDFRPADKRALRQRLQAKA